jgi:hypothetical protein
MAGTNYVINPVKATCMKYSGTDHGIQGLNDTCFGICAAFSGTYDTFAMDPKCTQACTDFIEQRKHEIFGVGSCDHQVPYRPVAWQQVPRFVPQLMQKKGMTVEEARNTCKQMCNQRVPLLAAECREKCDLDANAVEEYKPVKAKPQPVRSVDLKKEETKHPVAFWTIVSLIILLLIALAIFAYKKMGPK